MALFFPEVDPAFRVVLEDIPGRKRPGGRSHNSWLRQVHRSLEELRREEKIHGDKVTVSYHAEFAELLCQRNRFWIRQHRYNVEQWDQTVMYH